MLRMVLHLQMIHDDLLEHVSGAQHNKAVYVLSHMYKPVFAISCLIYNVLAKVRKKKNVCLHRNLYASTCKFVPFGTRVCVVCDDSDVSVYLCGIH